MEFIAIPTKEGCTIIRVEAIESIEDDGERAIVRYLSRAGDIRFFYSTSNAASLYETLKTCASW